MPERPTSNQVGLVKLYSADTRKVYDLATCIALEWGDPESRTSRAGQHFTVRNVSVITMDRENQMKLEVYGEEAEHARFGASGQPHVPFEMSANGIRIDTYGNTRTLKTTKNGSIHFGPQRPEITAANVAATDFAVLTNAQLLPHSRTHTGAGRWQVFSTVDTLMCPV